MFEVNSYMIQKMGWIEYSPTRGLYHNGTISSKKYNLFDDDQYVRYFIEFENRNEFFVIKELTEEDVSFIVKEFNSNEELFKLIIENEACNSSYERHFRLNKILK